MKRFVAILLVFTIPFFLTACSLSDFADLLYDIADTISDRDTAEESIPAFDYEIVGDGEDEIRYPGSVSQTDISLSPADDPVIDETLPPVEENTSDNTPQNTPKGGELVGEWVTASRQGNTIYLTYYWFGEDGTVSSYSAEYVHASQYPDLFGDWTSGWSALPMGYPLDVGTYKVTGSTLTLTFTHDDVGNTYEPPIVEEYAYSVSGDTLVLSGCTYLNDIYLSIEEIAEILGVDTSID